VVVFGSEIKSLLQHDGLAAAVSLPHLLEYFTFQNIFTDGTLFAGVKLLRPGHRVRLSAERGALRPERYWDFDFRDGLDGASDDEYLEELDRLFRPGGQPPACRRCPGGRPPLGRYGLRQHHGRGGTGTAATSTPSPSAST